MKKNTEDSKSNELKINEKYLWKGDPNVTPKPYKSHVDNILRVMKVGSFNAHDDFVSRKKLYRIWDGVNPPVDVFETDRMHCSFNASLVELGYYAVRGTQRNAEYKYIGNYPFQMEDAISIATSIANRDRNYKTQLDMQKTEQKLHEAILSANTKETPATVTLTSEKSEITENSNQLMDFVNSKDKSTAALSLDEREKSITERERLYDLQIAKLTTLVEALNLTISK